MTALHAVMPEAGPHGGDGRALARALGLDPASILDLSVSLNPFAPDPSPALAAALTGDALGRYPDDHDRSVATAALAGALGVEPGRVLLTNGGSEAIALVAAELRTGWVDEPEFSLYARHLEALAAGAPRWRSDPHNPTGLLAGARDLAGVWDEAFYPLAAGRWTRAGRPGSPVVVGSLTKVLGCPGLRVGYVVVPEDDGASLGRPGLCARLVRRQPSWSVGTPALVVLPALIETADVDGWARAVAEHRSQLVEVLRAHGLSPRPSDANFVLCDGGGGSCDGRPGLRERLAPLGVVVRDCSSFGLPGTVRVAVPDGAGLERLDRALRSALGGAGGGGEGAGGGMRGARS